jgi:hypothetical protein
MRHLKRILSFTLFATLPALAGLVGGCESEPRERTVSNEESVKIKRDGTTITERETVKQRSDGTVVKETVKDVDR